MICLKNLKKYYLNKMINGTIILVSGVARSGKDTFFNLLSKNLPRDFSSYRFAFADQIKEDLKPLLMNNFNINPLNPTDEQKEIIRPLMVSYGTHVARRIDKKIWIKKLHNKIKKISFNENSIAVVTDTRYPNEQDYFSNKFKNCINVHIERHGFKPINEEEEENTPLLKSKANYVISWGDLGNNTDLGKPFIDGFINERLKIR